MKIYFYIHRLIIEFIFAFQRLFIRLYILFNYTKINTLNNKIVVYTAITGNKDTLKEFKKTKGVTYICFTDNPKIHSKTWTIKQINIIDKTNPRLNAKHPKILPHKYFSSFEYSVWIDGSIIIKTDIRYLVYKYLKNHSITFFKHHKRNCIYEEAKECIALKKGDTIVINKQMTIYRKKNYPENNGLIAATVIFRKHNNTEIIKAMEKWWHEIITYSIRDQLSFNFVAYENKLKYGIINKNLYLNCYFSMIKHKR